MDDSISPQTPIRELRGVGPDIEARLKRLGVTTVVDLVTLLPRRIEDRGQLRDIKDLQPNEPLVIQGVIEKVSSRRSNRGVLIITAKIKDETGSINAIWFNQRYLLSFLKLGARVTLFGEKKLIKSMGAPFFVKKMIEKPEVVPIYPSTGGLSQAAITKLMSLCRPVISQLPDYLPSNIREAAKLNSRNITLSAVHFQPSDEHLDRARQLLGQEELLTVCLAAIFAKRKRQTQIASVKPIDEKQIQQICLRFDYQLTDGQQKVIEEVATDLGKSYPMNRLLYGEVGSGKTAVGLVAAVAVAMQGKKVLWLSPTTTLAEQQARLTKEFCEKFQIAAALVSGSVKEKTDNAAIVVGTHALLHSRAIQSDVGLVIIDEQQRFGVEQRNLLLDQYPGSHLLMLSATPIPRTLAHTLFGHIDISYLRDKPQHQQPITTKVFRDSGRARVEEHIKARIDKEQPGYVICPLIDPADRESDELFAVERKAVKAEFQRIQKLFPKARVGVLHGKMSSSEKSAVMTDFRVGKIDVLVATSVVEVGIDNPEATWILIEEADRFGLSQLHQLRGRVGRGDKPSVCFLHNSLSTEKATERLNALIDANDGLEIAELDLRLRGPGEIAGTDQSGLPGIRYADLGDTDLVKSVYQQAEQIGKAELAAYPELARAVQNVIKNGLTAT